MVVSGTGGRGVGSLFNWGRVSVLQNESVLEMDGVMAAQQCESTGHTELRT